PVVFISGMEEGVFPHQRSLDEQNVEEERRLAYVGITRAMDRLYLVHARARTLWGAAQYNIPSRFLDEIPTELTERQTVGGRPTSWDSGGGWGGESRGRGAGGGWDGGGWSGRRPRAEDEADHETLGTGRRITGLEKKQLDEEVVEQFFAPGDRVLHATLGEGTVLAMQSGGIVLIRFENDGSERRLMASVAPLKKLRS
ncbi:MAG TPA: 3'-5' exonuclease, partial [Thermoleophilia bacterium]|nr:3'-5' exonuclease [Thermoleophilia bacterium]